MSDDGAHTGEEALLAVRREKLVRLRGRGENPFENRTRSRERSLIGELRQRFLPALLEPPSELRYDPERVAELRGEQSVVLLGRVVARRGFGKAVFLRLRDLSGELQLFAKLDILKEAFALLEELDVADHVEVSGPVMVTKTGELSLECRSLKLLTKALRGLPDKWHGLTDVDLRYRQRYVDLVANPEVKTVMVARSLTVQGIRDFLDRRGFLEVETPTLHTLVGGATARPFKTHHNALDLELFLRIAPELYLKRLLVGGLERVYEIGRCYRNEGISTRHNPEFTMLEFYQAYATYTTLMDSTEELLRHVDEFVARGLETAGEGPSYEAYRAARSYTFSEAFARVPLNDALGMAVERAALPSDVLERLSQIATSRRAAAAGAPHPTETGGAIRELAACSERAKSVDWSNLVRALGACDNDGERSFVAYEYLAEPFLASDYRAANGEKSVPVFIIDYPAAVSPLARPKDSDPTLVDRFELFVEGREICNAFSELNDPDEQAARFREQLAQKQRGAEEAMDYDADYLRALEHGMPPAAGFGMGIDRLVMALCNQASIRDVIAFPLLRPEKAGGA